MPVKDIYEPTAREILTEAVKAIEEKKGNRIVSLEFTPEISSICDYFLICDASNIRQTKAIYENITERLRKNLKIKPDHVEGIENAEWILIDYIDVVIHIFLTEKREFYNLESLWADAKQTVFS